MKNFSILFILILLLAACAQIAAPLATDTPAPTEAPMPTEMPPATNTPQPAPAESTRPSQPPRSTEFSTDWSKRRVSADEFLSGGPPKDGIPAIDHPRYESIVQADDWLEPQEPVILIELNGEARAYPIQILTWHEIVNDTLGGTPIVVTFCPLCNTAVAFDRRIDGQTTTFGTTGQLRNLNLVMYDRLSESWWQQATGDGLVGEYYDRLLDFYPATILGWQAFKEAYPGADVLSRDTGHVRDYGRNPYPGYDDVDRGPFSLDDSEPDTRLPPMARVATVELGEETVAYPYTELEMVRAINDRVGGQEIVVLWEPGTASALDAGSVSGGRDVGAVGTFDRQLDERTLTFAHNGETFVDEETGSRWTFLGQAVSGPLAGRSLAPVVNVNHFWFSWAAFRPKTRVYRAQEAAAAPQAPAVQPDAQVSDAPSAADVQVPFDFEIKLYQGQETLGDTRVSFSDAFDGKPVVAVLWAGLCPTCRRELPLMQEAYQEYGDRITFVGIDIGPFTGLGFEPDGRALLQQLEITFPAGGPPDGAFMRDYRILGTPSSIFFSADGKVVNQWSGLIPAKKLRSNLEELLES